MILVASLFTVTKDKWGPGAKSLDNFWNHNFQSKEIARFDTKRALKKVYFHSLAEKGRAPDPHDPPSCTPGNRPSWNTLAVTGTFWLKLDKKHLRFYSISKDVSFCFVKSSLSCFLNIS